MKGRTSRVNAVGRSVGHTGRAVARLAVGGAAATAAWHVLPAASWLPGVRARLLPRLDRPGPSDAVALTFDDGPDPVSTPCFLRVLDELRVRATFFVLGSALVQQAGLGRAMVEAGHEVAVHGWSHRRPWSPAPRLERREVAWTADAVREVCGTEPRWYRPPYGILTGPRLRAARLAELEPVLWSVWGRDWTAHADARSVWAEVEGGLRPGATVLLHDTDRMSAPGSWHATLTALPALVRSCRSRGLTVGPLAPPAPTGASGGTDPRVSSRLSGCG